MADGFVRARKGDFDNRAQHLSLTYSRQVLFDETLPKMREQQRLLRASLTQAELDVLYSALDKLELAAD